MRIVNALLIELFLFLPFGLPAQTPNTWTEKAALGWNIPASSFPPGRHNAISFGINGKGYYGTGDDYNSIIFADFWEYNPPSNTWTQKANFGGGPRSGAVAFVIGGKGYAGTGGDGFQGSSDFWEYDPTLNTWTSKAAFPFGQRSEASGFSIGTKGYLVAGLDSFSATADLWEYNSLTNAWTFKSYLPGGPRENACAFSIGSKGYVGCGKYYNGSAYVFANDFWQYDPATNSWLQKANMGGGARGEAISFVSGGMGYIGLGWSYVAYFNDLWAYDTTSNSWSSKAAFGGTPRFSSTAFATGTKAYVIGGSDGTIQSDLWEYDPLVNSWAIKVNPSLYSRRYGINFSIGDKGYVGLGNFGNLHYNDLWEFQPASNTWTQKAAFPGIPRVGATSFELLGKGFVCGGQGNNNYLNDLWIYNPANNTWTQKTSFPGGVRRFAAGFSIGNKGYFGTGQTGPLKKDWWEYDLVTDSWSQLADFGGTERTDATGFSIGKYGYVVFGLMIGGQSKELWKFDPDSNKWTQRADFGGITRYDAAGFSIGGKGYAGTGFGPSANEQNDFWEYDPVSNTWTQRTQFPGSPRLGCSAFSAGGKGYMGAGFGDTGYKNDFYEYTPPCQAPPTVVFSSGGTSVCSGEKAFLFVHKGYSYQWLKNGNALSGATKYYYETGTAGTYACQITGACSTVVSNSIVVNLNSLPSATITAAGPLSFCSGGSVLLQVPLAANRSYQWKKNGVAIPGATSSAYVAASGGTYKATVTNTNTGCSKTTGTGTTVSVNPNPTVSVTPQGPTTFCLGDSVQLKASYNSSWLYQWKKNNTNITGATSNKMVAKTAGNYKVKVTNGNGCTSISSSVQISVPCREEAIHPLSPTICTAYPNPTRDHFYFRLIRETTTPYSIKIIDPAGVLLESIETKKTEWEWNASLVPAGIYAAIINNGNQKQIIRLIKE